MISKLSHISIYVLDIDKAYDFYVNILGFKVHTDALMENGYRWLTVTAPDAPGFEIILMPILHEAMVKTEQYPDGIEKETQDAFRFILQKGMMGAGVLYTPDCRAAYKELSAKGVQFKSEPKEQFYGIEAVMFDGCGNWFSLTQPKEMH
jgi:catechol 2,3-dioxygenase-like lactoylglutathione lyase family enzyme